MALYCPARALPTDLRKGGEQKRRPRREWPIQRYWVWNRSVSFKANRILVPEDVAFVGPQRQLSHCPVPVPMRHRRFDVGNACRTIEQRTLERAPYPQPRIHDFARSHGVIRPSDPPHVSLKVDRRRVPWHAPRSCVQNRGRTSPECSPRSAATWDVFCCRRRNHP